VTCKGEQLGVAASPPLSHPFGAEPVPVSGKAGIANAGAGCWYRGRAPRLAAQLTPAQLTALLRAEWSDNAGGHRVKLATDSRVRRGLHQLGLMKLGRTLTMQGEAVLEAIRQGNF
jgi:hypothetical protein